MSETQNNLIPRKQYMQTLRNLKDQNIIKVITGVRRCGKSTLLQMFADELLQNGMEQEQIQFSEIYSFTVSKCQTCQKWKVCGLAVTCLTKAINE